MSDKPIVLIKTGDALADVIEAQGDYDRIFGRFVEPDMPYIVCQAHRGEPLPPVESVAGVMISGSASSMRTPEAWVEPLIAWSRQIVEQQIPVLGVCYGHQLLAVALGGRVDKNPNYEIGTIDIALNEEGMKDELLSAGLSDQSVPFNALHEDAVVEPPDCATNLASSALCKYHAFRLGPYAWTVQFHPEFDGGAMQLFLKVRGENLRSEVNGRGEDGDAAVDAVSANIADTPRGERLLREFVQIVRRRSVSI